MTRHVRIAALIALLPFAALLAGCPPGMGGRNTQQNMPPGMLPPPGMDSGGARTLMDTTITAPSDHYLLVKFALSTPAAKGAPAEEPKWQTCRRVIPLTSYLLIEGINYDGRDAGAEKDVNQLIPASELSYFYWKYEAKPVPPAEENKPGESKPRKKKGK